MDRLNGLGLGVRDYDGYDVIYLKNVTSANDINISDDSDNSYYIGANDDSENPEEGNLESNAVFKGGDDTLYMEGSITASGDLKMGSGDDTLTIETDILAGGSADLGVTNTNSSDQDTVVLQGNLSGSLATGDDIDHITVVGEVTSTGTIDAGNDVDYIYLKSNLAGEVSGGSGVDYIYLEGNSVDGASLDAGDDGDNIYLGYEEGVGSTAGTTAGEILGGEGGDVVQIYGDILSTGNVVTGPTNGNANDSDIVHFYANNINGALNLGVGNDILHFYATKDALNVVNYNGSLGVTGESGIDTVYFDNISTSDFADESARSSFEAKFDSIELFYYSDTVP
ncbi:hypothetical protein THIOSC15_2600002 [uncultured Thiomicrorhabdus sp.]